MKAGKHIPAGHHTAPSTTATASRPSDESSVTRESGHDTTRHKFINAPDACVLDNLYGYAAANPGVRVLKHCSALVRHDYDVVASTGKVSLISGGGSGHEPGFAGFVGEGLLTAAVAGPIYTSPFSDNILATIRTVGTKSTGGVLIFVVNYTGDRLTFGIALEKAKAEGIHADFVLVGEDTALEHTHPSTGRRGLCGSVFMMKIAGAMAEERQTLEDIKSFVDDKKHNMGTITVALTPCSLPGKDEYLFRLPRDKMELGMGVHGEAGALRIPLLSAAETAQIMIDHLRNPASKNALHLKKGDRVALMLNNLGGLTTLEMNILAKETIACLERMSVHIVRVFTGLYMTSLDSAGISICILKVDDKIVHYLDAPTSAPAWIKPYFPENCHRFTAGEAAPIAHKLTKAEEDDVSTSGQACVLSPHERDMFRVAILRACESLVAHEKELNKLDSESGDGDCGTTLAAGAHSIMAYLETKPKLQYPGLVMRQLSHVISTSMGGTSGALYSLFFLGASRSFQILSGYHAWVGALELGMKLIMKYGMAHVGDRTMLDTLNAALTELQKNPGSYDAAQVHKSLQATLEAMSAAVHSTLTMKPRAGRATYVHPDALKHPDPGARAVEIWLGWAIRSIMS